jgi:hypothetical protein
MLVQLEHQRELYNAAVQERISDLERLSLYFVLRAIRRLLPYPLNGLLSNLESGIELFTGRRDS